MYAIRVWISPFLGASLEARGGGSYVGLKASAATFLIIAIGALGCWIGGWASDRWGRTALTMIAMTASGLCALAIGLTFAAAPALTLLIAVVIDRSSPTWVSRTPGTAPVPPRPGPLPHPEVTGAGP